MQKTLALFVTMKALAVIWLWLITYVFDPLFGTYVHLRGTSVLFGFLAVNLVAQYPLFVALFSEISYPMPQVLQCLAFMEVVVYASLFDIQFLILAGYISVMIWGVVALAIFETWRPVNGGWTIAMYMAHTAALLMCIARFYHDGTNDPCALFCIVWIAFHAFSMVHVFQPWCASDIFFVVVKCVLLVELFFMPNSLIEQIIFAVTYVLVLSYDAYVLISERNEEIFVEPFHPCRPTLVGYVVARIIIVALCYMEPQLDQFRVPIACLFGASFLASSLVTGCGVMDVMYHLELVMEVSIGLKVPVYVITSIACFLGSFLNGYITTYMVRDPYNTIYLVGVMLTLTIYAQTHQGLDNCGFIYLMALLFCHVTFRFPTRFVFHWIMSILAGLSIFLLLMTSYEHDDFFTSANIAFAGITSIAMIAQDTAP